MEENQKDKKNMIIGLIALLVLLLVAFIAIYIVIYFLLQGLNYIGSLAVDLVEKISTLDTVLIVALISGLLTVVGLVVNSIIKLKEYKRRTAFNIKIKAVLFRF